MQAHRTKREAYAFFDLALIKQNQFKRPAADIAHNAGRHRITGNDAKGGQTGFFKAIDHLDRKTGFRGHTVTEFLAIGGSPHRGGGQHVDMGDLHGPKQGGKAVHGNHGKFDPLWVELAGVFGVTTKATHDLFVEDRHGGAGHAIKNDKPHRVGANIYDCDAVGSPLVSQHKMLAPVGRLWSSLVIKF